MFREYGRYDYFFSSSEETYELGVAVCFIRAGKVLQKACGVNEVVWFFTSQNFGKRGLRVLNYSWESDVK